MSDPQGQPTAPQSCPQADQPLMLDQLKGAIVAKLAQSDPGRMKSINWSAVEAALGQVDGQIQQYLPIIGALAPPQAQAIVGLVATVVHALNGVVNPSPAPGSDTQVPPTLPQVSPAP